MPLTNPRSLPGFLVYFAEAEAKLAFAIAQAMLAGGIGGGSGTIDNAALAQAIEDALADPGIIVNPTSVTAIASAINTGSQRTALAQAIEDALADPGIIVNPTSVTAIASAINAATELTKTKTITSTTATITAGAVYVSIKNIGAANGTIDGVAIEPGDVEDYPVVGNRTYPSFNIDGTGTTLKIMEIR